MNPPGQSIIDIFNTTTPTPRSRPPNKLSIDALYTATLHIYIYIYKEGRSTPLVNQS